MRLGRRKFFPLLGGGSLLFRQAHLGAQGRCGNRYTPWYSLALHEPPEARRVFMGLKAMFRNQPEPGQELPHSEAGAGR